MQTILSSLYLAPIHYYTHLYHAKDALLDIAEYYEKQTYRNRCHIAGPQGIISLTIPIKQRPQAKTPMRDIMLSEHGHWQHMHWQALVSAYERTPYFEYYADDLSKIYSTAYDRLIDFNAALQQCICDLLDISNVTAHHDTYILPHEGQIDLRQCIHPKRPHSLDNTFEPQSYYQVFAERLGFLPNLSIIDLLCNMGPESLLILRDSYKII